MSSSAAQGGGEGTERRDRARGPATHEHEHESAPATRTPGGGDGRPATPVYWPSRGDVPRPREGPPSRPIPPPPVADDNAGPAVSRTGPEGAAADVTTREIDTVPAPPRGIGTAAPPEPQAPRRPGRPAEARPRAAPAKKAAPAKRPIRRPSRRRVMVRKVDPWSVLKLSLIFYFCLLLVFMAGLVIFWAAVNQLGIIQQLLDFLADLQLAVTIDGGMVARAIFLIGLLNVILWSGVNVFLAFLYNLIADLVGGVRITLGEDE